MTYQRVIPKVILAHVALLGFFLTVPLIRGCEWFKTPPPEVIEIDLSSLPPPPVERNPSEPVEPEEEAVIPEATPIPTARPTARPTATPTPAPEATAVPTATPRPLPTSTPTPKPRYLTPEEIRARIEQQQQIPEPIATSRPLSPEELAKQLREGLSPVTTISHGISSGNAAGGVSFAGVGEVLYNKLFSAWVQPRMGTNLSATAEVVVERSGRIVTARLKTRSGDTEFDRSVESALSAVTFAKPLPDEYDGATRTFNIEFQLSR